jgi:hypothetical protein
MCLLVNALARGVADREELGSTRIFNDLSCLTRCKTSIEILGDFGRLATLFDRETETKNPAGVAARGGVEMGLVQQTRPTPFYRLTASAATQEAQA